MRLAALSVDLDEIPCYHAIHGLPMPDAGAPSAHAVYERAMPRLRELFASMGVPCTFFVIGRDLEHQGAFEQARGAAAEGHELANHSLSHRYDLVRVGRAAMADEVREGASVIARASGRTPAGFRAPGYTITDELFEVLGECGVAYDSSVFPCPMYWAAKTTKIGLIALRGRTSRSIVDTPAVLTAPADPYLAGRPYWNKGNGVLELPIGVTRGPRLPFIGTSIVAAGPTGVLPLTRAIEGRPLVNLELHGVDVLGAEDGLGYLAEHQLDLRIPVERKLATLRAVVGRLKTAGYQFVTLLEAAGRFADQLRH